MTVSKIAQAAFDVFNGKISMEEAAKKYNVNLSELQRECKNLPNYLAGNSEPVADNPPETLSVNNELKEAFDTVRERLFPKGDVFTTEQKLNKEDFEKINKEIAELGKIKGHRDESVDKYEGAWFGGGTTKTLIGQGEGTVITTESTVEQFSNGAKPLIAILDNDSQLNDEITVWTVERTVEKPDGTKIKTVTKNYFDTKNGELKATAHDNGTGTVNYINYGTGKTYQSKAV